MKEWQNPKNFVIQLGALIALYVSLTSLITLIFGIINIKFPDELDYMYVMESTRESMRISIAFLVVFFPAYLAFTRYSNQSRRHEEHGEYSSLAKWLIYLSLLAGVCVLLGDLVTVLIYFLNGEITTRFILKAVALFIIVGSALYYYILDVRGKIKADEKLSIQFGMGATALVAIGLIAGFMNIETPAQVREMRLDEQQVMDMQDMQWRIEEHYRVEKTLPTSLDAVYVDTRLPEAPEGRADYRYNVVDNMTYELCATFVESSFTDGESTSIIAPYPYAKDNYNWEHEAGEKCFKRVVIDEQPLKPEAM